MMDLKRLAYGFFNGVVEVFPEDSLQDLCRLNVTSFKATYQSLFTKRLFKFPEDNLIVVQHTADMLRYPYGLTFSCMEAS